MTRSARLLPGAALAAALLAGCAAAPPPPQKQPWDRPAARPTAAASAAPEGAAVAAPAPADELTVPPAAYAARFPAAEACEAAARRLQRSAPDRAWAVLKACVERGKFTLLARLVDGGWEKDLSGRQDAGTLLARVVAARGGDLIGDLATLRRARVPLFGLEPAMTNPDVYKGRVLMFRARIEDVKALPGNRSTVRLAQVELASKAHYVDAGGYSNTTSSSTSSSGSGSGSGSYKAQVNGKRYTGSGSGSGSYSGSRSSTSTYTSTYQKRRIDNGLQDTGRSALARMNGVDPFLEPGRDFVVVGRFDGVREEPGSGQDEPEITAVFTLYGYFEASPLLVE